MCDWRCNPRPAQHCNSRPHPYSKRTLRRLEENLLIVTNEYGNMTKIRQLFIELYRLEATFNSAANIDKQKLRDEMQRTDEEILTLIDAVIAEQVKGDYRPLDKIPPMSPMETVEQQIADITMWIQKITSRIEDLRELHKLKGQRQKLYTKRNRLKYPSEKRRIMTEISEISRSIIALRNICALKNEHYQPSQVEGPPPKYSKRLDGSRNCHYPEVATEKHPMEKSTRGWSKFKFNSNNRKKWYPSSPRSSHNFNITRPRNGYKRKIVSNKSRGGLVNGISSSSFKPFNFNAMTSHASTSSTFGSHVPNYSDNVDKLQNIKLLKSILPEVESGRDVSNQRPPNNENTEDSRRLLSESSIERAHNMAPVSSIVQSFETINVLQNPISHCQQAERGQANGNVSTEMIDDFPEFNDEQKAFIKQATYRTGPSDTVLISKFNTSITREDIRTLLPLTWLNDEVINFYMNLLTERSELRSSDGYPKVYAMNTFFTQRLCSGGYTAVRRWTKDIDIFAFDIIPVPVHCGNVHWCMAIINMKEKTIKYYDSIEPQIYPYQLILSALEQYLKEESLDKRKIEFDFSGWNTENVTDNPRQQNGSDCGVFSCMIAELVCRNRPLVFNQQHINQFREKMVLEICTGKMLL